MNTTHRIIVHDSRKFLEDIPDQSIDLVVTSPPYPMIQMWDDLFCKFSPKIKTHLKNGKGDFAFEFMHQDLDLVWVQLHRVMKEGAIACINVGDAVRTLGNRFQIYLNHCRISMSLWNMGFDSLPTILWRKPTNAPNKFMGSGTLPVGAYVTLEHEHILIFRKGAKREFKTVSEKKERMQSSFFWEERNKWFSDSWDFKGVKQKMDDNRRSAAYPFELPYRLINMYSLYGDTVLDPFVGTGTTITAAIASGRSSIGIEFDQTFLPIISNRVARIKPVMDKIISDRLLAHVEFLNYIYKKTPKYNNEFYKFPVITKPESKMQFFSISKIEPTPLCTTVSYEPL
jgi:modification methylase